jgi:hypothetical protein
LTSQEQTSASTTGDPSAQAGQSDGLARATMVLKEAGYSDEDIKELGPAAARVASRYEAEWSGMADSLKAAKDAAAGIKPGDGAAPTAPTAPAASPAAAGKTDAVSNKFIDTLRSQYDDTLADSVKGYGDYVREQVMNEITQRFGPIEQTVQQYAHQRAAEGINTFFDGFVKTTPAYAEVFGSDPTKANAQQLAKRGEVVQLAIGLKAEMARRGVNLSGNQALARAGAVMTRELNNQQAIKQVQAQVQQQARQFSIPPGTAGSGQQGTGGDWRAGARATVQGWQQARGV